MKFGVFTVSTPEYDIRETVKMLKELGYDGVEWRVANPLPDKKPENYSFEGRYWSYNRSTVDVSKIDESAPEIKGICDEYGIETCSLTTYLSSWNLTDIERTLKAAVIMGCKNIRAVVPGYNESESYIGLFDKTVVQTREVEKLAAKYGVRVNFEIHMGNIIPSASAAYRFASNFDPKHIGIIYDPGNMVYEGFENYRMGIELLGEYLTHVHVKNGVWNLIETTDDGVEIWKPGWAPFKKGHADIKKLLQVLKDVNYQGYVSVEDFSNEEDTYSKLKNNIDYLRKISS